MTRRIRSMNLGLDQALMRHDMSHIGVTDTSSIAREGYTTHGLHLYSWDKKRLMHLIAERIVGGQAVFLL
jgi:hypothetical protein